MTISYRGLIAVCVIAIGLITVALLVRVGESRPITFPAVFDAATRTIIDRPSSFFYEQNSADGTKPNVLQSQIAPVSPVNSPTASAYLVGNVQTGKIYFEHNINMVLPVASMSKLITAVAATDTMSPETRITITDSEMQTATDTSRLAVGETFTLNELLLPMLLNSSNVAAEAIASSTNRAAFLELMTSYAWEIGMPKTFFADPSGVNPLNQSTASDFFALAKYLYTVRSDILLLTRNVFADTPATDDHGAHHFESIHPLVVDANFLGGKTGHTPEAKDTMLSIVKIANQPIAIIVLSSYNREADTRMLESQVERILQR